MSSAIAVNLITLQGLLLQFIPQVLICTILPRSSSSIDNAISIINSRLKDGIPPSKLIRLHQMVTKDHLCRDSIDLNHRGTDIKRNATKITKSLFSTSSMYETKITKILLSTYSKQDLISIGMPCGKNYKNIVLDLFHARLGITKNATNYKNVLDLYHARFDITRSATKITKKILDIFHARRITRNETKMTKILFLTSSMQGLILQGMQQKLQKSCSWLLMHELLLLGMQQKF